MQVFVDPWVCGTLWGFCVLLFAVAAPCLGTVFYLAQDGDDRGAGSRKAPWRSIEKANATLKPGDSAVFLPGAYEGTLAPTRGGKPGSPIVYRSEERHGAVLVGGEARGLTVDLGDRDHVILEGFRITPGDGRWLRAEDCDGLTVRGCYMEKSGSVGTSLAITRCRHVRLIDNVFRKDRVGGNMCNLIGCSYVVVEGNTFTRVGHCPLLLDTVNHAVVRGNCFHNCWGRNYELWASGRVLVEGNIVTEALDSAHSADSRAKHVLIDSIIRFNRVFRNRHTPLDSPSYMPRLVWTPHIREPFRLVNTRIYHNTITDNLGYGWDLWGINISANVFVNNIFFQNDKYGSGVQVTMSESMVGDNRFFNNLFRGTEDGQRTLRYGKRFLTAEEANDRSHLMGEHWKEFDENVSAEPGFVDAENHDFRLREDSPCIDAGRPLTRTTQGGRGREVPVYDARYFYDGFGIEGEVGDLVAIGNGDRVARIERVEINYYQPGVLVLDREMQWDADAAVSLPWTGEGPDIGAYEYGASLSRRAIAKAEPADTQPGQRVTFRVEIPRGDVDRAEWDFQDGATARGAMVTHTFREAGQFGVRVRTRYEDGREDVDVVFVKVAAPVDPRAPMLRVDFEDETILEWGHLFKIYRGNRSVGHEYVSGGFGGGKCVRLFAEADGSDLSCALAPGEWDIDTYPFIRFAYRIPKGVPVGLWLQAFPHESEERVLLVGGSPSRASGPYPDTGTYTLADDGEWHEITLDARTVRERLKDVRYLRRFRFYTHGNAKEGQGFRFDEFEILPVE